MREVGLPLELGVLPPIVEEISLLFPTTYQPYQIPGDGLGEEDLLGRKPF
jgi:hypothetical protein